MTRLLEIDLSQDEIAEPLDAYRIRENYFGLAYSGGERPYLITCGISSCKGIVAYHPPTGKGLLGHLSVVGDLDRELDKITQGFGEGFEEAEVHLVEAVSSEPPRWPTLDSICDYFMRHNPRSISVDRNASGKIVRGISLNLRDGKVSEIDGSDGWTWSKLHDTSLNQPICTSV